MKLEFIYLTYVQFIRHQDSSITTRLIRIYEQKYHIGEIKDIADDDVEISPMGLLPDT